MSIAPLSSTQDPAPQIVEAAAERIKLRMKRTVEDIVAIGVDLRLIKENLPHGEFLSWVEKEIDLSEWAVRNFMNVANKYGSKSGNFPDLPASVLYELSAPSTPEPVRQIIEAKAEKGETVSVKEVQDLKRRMKEQRESDEKKLKALGAENQALKDSQELARIKAHEEAAKAVEAELAALRAEKRVMEDQLKVAKEEAKTAASQEAEAIIKNKMAEKEADLKKLRQKAGEAERRLESLERQESGRKKRIAELDARAKKIASVDWEAQQLLKKTDNLAKQMTEVLLEIEGLEHEHNASTLKQCAQTASMCENLAIALRMVPHIGADT